MKRVVMLIVCLVGGVASQAGIVTFSPTADSYIRESDGTATSHGSEVYMVTNNGTGSNKIRWSFVKFDLSSITETITGIKLELQADKTGGNTLSLTHAVYGLVTGENWMEAGLNWTNAPAVDKTNKVVDLANVYGGAALSDFSYTGVVSGNSGGPVAAVIDQATGGLAVDFLKADSDKVITFIIARTGDPSPTGQGIAWATKESTYTDVAKPLLTVYTIPEPATMIVLGLGGLLLRKRK